MRRIFSHELPLQKRAWCATAFGVCLFFGLASTTLARAPMSQALSPALSTSATREPPLAQEYVCEPSAVDGVSMVASDQVCGKIILPEDPASADGPKIEIHYKRLPAARAAQSSTLLFIQGGPGGASWPLAPVMKGLLRELNVDHDFLFVDLRGTGHSGALNCETSTNSVYNNLTPAQIEQEIAACLRPLATRAQHYTTINMAGDLETLRRALGIGQYKIWAVSYGARVALEYLRRYPNATASVVLDSPGPVSIALPSQLPSQLQKGLQLLGDECVQDAPCANAFGHAWQNTQALVAQLQKQPVQYEYRHPLSGQAHTYIITSENFLASLNSFFYARATRSQLSEVLYRATQNDWRMLVQFDRDFWSTADVSMGLHMAVVCNEDRQLWPDGGWPKVLGEDIASAYKTACDKLAPPTLPDDFFAPVTSLVPTLILSGEKDLVTPAAMAQTIGKHLTQSQHVIVKNAVHAVSFDGCIPTLITRFFSAPLSPLDSRGCENNLAIPPAYSGGLDVRLPKADDASGVDASGFYDRAAAPSASKSAKNSSRARDTKNMQVQHD